MAGRKIRTYRAYDLIAMSQVGLGQINTAFIERLNATFRARMPALARRTRSLARTTHRLETELFWSGAVYNFCAIHTSLEATPTMAAGWELVIISAVIIGGTSLMGGKGTIRGTLTGIIFLGVLVNGMTLLNISEYWQHIVQGTLILAAVLANRER